MLHSRRIPNRGVAIALLAGALVSGCAQLPALLGQFVPTTSESKSTLVEPTSDLFAKFGIKPEDSEVLPSGILAKNSSKFSGTVFAPSGILAKNSSKYRVSVYAEEPIANAYVMLWSPTFRYLIVDGKKGVTKTDEKGNYDFGDFSVPAGRKIIVRMFNEFGDDLMTFRYAREGANRFNITLASTLVTRYAMFQADLSGKTLVDFDADRFPALEGATRALLDNGALAVDRESYLAKKPLMLAYQVAFKAAQGDLKKSWRDFLGFDPVDIQPDPPPPTVPVEVKHQDSNSIAGPN